MGDKILYLHGVTAIGGAEQDLSTIIDGLDRKRLTPVVVCSDRGPFTQKLEASGVQVTILPLPSWRKARSFPLRIPAVYQLYRFLLREHIRLVHINDMWWIPQGYWASRLAKIPCLAHIRQELEPKRIKQYWLQSPRMLIAVSAQVKQQLEQGGIAPQGVRVLYSGVSFCQRATLGESQTIRERHNIQPNQPVIGTVAHLFPRKGYEYLIVALAQVCKVLPDVQCLIIGEGDPAYKAQLEELMRRRGLESRIRFLGHQPDVLPYLQAMDVMVLPSIMEGLGIAVLEAMAAGKPVIATWVGGIPEIVEDGVTGILVPPRDDEKLAMEIVSLLRDPERRSRMGQAGIKKTQEYFTTERLCQQLMEFYRELLVSEG